MNPKVFCRCHVVFALCLVAFAGCGSGSIGADPCSTSAECTALPLSQAADEEIPVVPDWKMEMVEVRPEGSLSIDWVKPLPGSAVTAPGIYNRLLQSDASGKLVVFALDEAQQGLSVARLDDAGEVLEKATVAAPDGWTGGSKTRAGVGGRSSVTSIDGSLGLKAIWFTEQSGSGESTAMQKLIFEADIKLPPKRWDLANGMIDDMLQDVNGDLYVFQSDPDNHVTKLDGETRRALWTQTNFPDPRPEGGSRRLYVAGVPLDDGRVVALSEAVESALENAVSFLDANGKRTRTLTYVPTDGFLLNAGDHATYVASDFGDVMIFKLIDPAHNEVVQFIRDDYTLLSPEASAIDPSGNVYFATRNGSRLDPKPTLCRAHVSGGGNCYELQSSHDAGAALAFDGLVARDDGELFFQSGNDLVHVTYPH